MTHDDLCLIAHKHLSKNGFGEDTNKMIDAGWNRSTRTLSKYLHLID